MTLSGGMLESGGEECEEPRSKSDLDALMSANPCVATDYSW
eukprot:CAMPEP_0178452928 /NCGR_PEP_ID=MMETSP0689_2-20121128/44523_1 /TAXON_ID=160604 /ORGANISM="Amphidinium massartii, Strain CS-259" /LENGTH=40 /DNA_ID= /DNA_START= /DNA_END= /DNA_ORIENTATION=